jgi:Calcineurin-like phosphoesterase/3-keto-disaccharide hydrolase/Purple acid Phosphatase, N-terminal domain
MPHSRLLSTGLLACALLAGWTSSAAGDLTRAPYLQLATPDSVTIVWRTNTPVKPVVRYGSAIDSLNQSTDASQAVLRVSQDVEGYAEVPRLYHESTQQSLARKARGKKSDPSTMQGTYQYEVTISGLGTHQTYYYAVYDGDTQLAGGDASYRFTTLPEPGSPASQRIWVVGDSGNGSRNQAMVHQAMLDFTAETKRPLDMFIHVGDMAYNDGTDTDFSDHFFKMYDPTLRNIVCWPAMGNHEGHTSRGLMGIGPYYDAYVTPTKGEAGGLPSGTEAYYSYQAGAIHFVCLNSHDMDRSPDGPMARWLEADLAEAKGDWIIAFWHHPPYTKGSHDSDVEKQLREMREYIMPIMEDGGVDLVLTGHSHIYERSMLMDGAYASPTTAEGVILDDGDGDPEGDGAYRKSAGLNPHEGAVQIVTGHGGAGLSRHGTMPVMRRIILEHGSVILDVDGDTLTGTMVNKDDVVRDVFSIVKRGSVEVHRVDKPWQHELLPTELAELFLDFENDKPGTPPSRFTAPSVDKAEFRVIQVDGNLKGVAASNASDETPALLVYDDYSGDQFEFQMEFSIPGDAESGTAAIVFGYKNPRNYYYVLVDADKNKIGLNRVVKGKESRIYRKKQKFNPDTWYEFEIDANVGKFVVEIDDVKTFAKQDDEISGKGKMGLRAEPGSEARFRSLQINKED